MRSGALTNIVNMRCPEICVFCLRNNSIEKICFSFRHEFIRISARKHVDDESPEKRHFTIVKSGNFADHGLWFCASHIPAASTLTSTLTADKWMLDGCVLAVIYYVTCIIDI